MVVDLPDPRLSDEAQALAWRKREAHAGNGSHGTGGGLELDPQIPHCQHVPCCDTFAWHAESRPMCRCAHGGYHHVVLSRTLTIRSSPTEVSRSPTKMSTITTSGGTHHHHSPRKIAL